MPILANPWAKLFFFDLLSLYSSYRLLNTEYRLPAHVLQSFHPISRAYLSHLQPDYNVSIRLLSSLSIAANQPFANSGPWIITLYKPIGKGKPENVADLLYLDMSTVHPSAIPEFVKTYKNHLTKHEIDGMESLRSLRLSVLNLGLIAEESIGFAQTAYASLQNAFPDKPAPKQ